MLQALLRNPLAEPYMLGAASGASFALLVGTVLGLAWWMLQGLAFAGAVAGSVSVALLVLCWAMTSGGRMRRPIFFTACVCRAYWRRLAQVPAECYKTVVNYWPLAGWLTGGALVS